MRTTLTIDDDVAGLLQRMAGTQGHSFKEVVNETLRKGLEAGGHPDMSPRVPFKVRARALGLKPGFDADRMNQLVDELEVEDFVRKAGRDDSSGY
jgi:hypothetical protein